MKRICNLIIESTIFSNVYIFLNSEIRWTWCELQVTYSVSKMHLITHILSKVRVMLRQLHTSFAFANIIQTRSLIDSIQNASMSNPKDSKASTSMWSFKTLLKTLVSNCINKKQPHDIHTPYSFFIDHLIASTCHDKLSLSRRGKIQPRLELR